MLGFFFNVVRILFEGYCYKLVYSRVKVVNVSFVTGSRSSQCSTTGVTKAVVCAILSVGWCI